MTSVRAPPRQGAVFDLGDLYTTRGFSGYGFVVHESFHGMQVRVADAAQ